MLRCYAFLAALILVGFTAFEAHADRRVAFVIGNSAYQQIPALKNPDKDARDVANTFRLAGFDVFVARDLTKLEFEEQFRNYLAAADGVDLAVVYYSGHGFQIGGENFLIPVDASLKAAADIEVQAIKLDDVLEQLRSKSKIQVIILDACRNNPFPRKDYWLRDQLIVAGDTGLAQVKSSLNTLIAFATEPGAVAYDGAGSLSPFSSAFTRRALAPDQEIRAVMAAVRRDVVKATNGKQVPWENSSLIDDVVLLRGPSQPAPEKVQPSGVELGALNLPSGAAEAIESRDISIPVGVGPVSLKLDFPTGDPAVSLKLASYPATGMLSLPDRILPPQSSLTADEVDNLRYEPQIGSATPVEVGFEIRAGNASRSATMKLSPSLNPCDQAAGAPLDLQGVVRGRLPNEIGGAAVEACEAAVTAYPDVARFHYELGRALLAAGKVDEARKAIQDAADKGHVRAVFELGSIASSGIGTAVDPTKASGFYSQASDKGDPYAMAAWGRALFNGLGVQRDTGKGLDLLLRAAAMGHINAMNDLALIFQEGRNGVPADPARALAFLRAGIERQGVYSMSILGLPARSTQTAAVCKPKVVRKTITKIKVVRIPTPKTPPVVEVPIDTGPAPWRGSNGDHPEPRGGGGSDDGSSEGSSSGSSDTGTSTGSDTGSTGGFDGVSSGLF
ncbi:MULTISPECIES: caspase family protein [unclassified Mesorhizobium]|uniref:caspase family protein n=1 Tax=unclassified Mesorhizobium TaxID=325217 RepID=UPI000FE3FCED|nr:MULTISPECIES: caspase family protein [unclassified Mesorhizobium]TGP25082.1 tetratricopeptide repeat protein [Mesorhizobium sp. M1D.F.Ca.ET.231.01.1.1]TGP36405.1 tetratricopeptide repeat protein [Mesorhizobium sp. M1D.F.Ca.ET.234.01.1.1]TGS49909.1 tetratricopeptide repeat protein [Mesorhizobium sp. M1D.F.Ca.ET.184.01.1.1]TGS64620.1 tetratricopeptide repeat protein [Mesorhizobium sp. M1D.F.Ca.ET.183.01.1.1]